MDNIFRFTGEPYDPSGLIYLRARYYDPVTGRFLTPDTLMGQLNDPLSQNLYLYCSNNPVVYIDPSGHIRICQIDDLGRGLWTPDTVFISSTSMNAGSQPLFAVVEIQPLFVEEISELEEYHYGRNALNTDIPLTEQEVQERGWIKMPAGQSAFHIWTGFPHYKYISPDGHREAVYDSKGILVTNPLDQGTYNFANPATDPGGHVIVDVIPWFLFGNEPGGGAVPWYLH